MVIPDTQPIPRHFFKYRSLRGLETDLERLRQTVVDEEVYWPSPLEFNDPFDCAPCYQFPKGRDRKRWVGDIARRRYPNSSRKDRRIAQREVIRRGENLERDFAPVMRQMLARSSVYSLATDPCNILLWSHYANSHKGVCLRFNAARFIWQFKALAPVVYQPDRPIVALGRESAEGQLRKILLTKSTLWEYENEWRTIGYSEPPGPRKLGPDTLDGIIIGSRTVDEDLETLRSWLAERKRAIAVFRAEEDPVKFGIRLKPDNLVAEQELASPSN